ncbi:hypothetical protein JCM11251_003910 [Rhodosporidiobolus azoricus]
MAGVFSEPSYVLEQPATAVLSETRPTHLSPTALAALNYLLDELLHIIVHAALHSPPASTTPTNSPPPAGTTSPPSSTSHARSSSSTFPSPLGPTEVLTTDRVKSSLARILGPTSLAKECILEGELAVRELVRRGSPSLRADGALKKSGMWGTPVIPSSSQSADAEGKEGEETGEEVKEREKQKLEVARQANEVFRALRAWVMQISGMGAACYGPAPNSLSEHLVALSPPKPPPTSIPSSPHLTFLLALYVERLLSTLSMHLLRLCGAVSARQSASDVATVADLEVALMEDDLVWSWAQGMRVRRFIEKEGLREREAAKKGSPVLGNEAERSGLSRAGSLSAPSGGTTTTVARNGAGHRKGSASLAVPSQKADVASIDSPPSLGRGSSFGGASTAAASVPAFGRRSSVESSRSGLNYTGPGRRASLGLGISGSTSTLALDGDTFDQLISGNKTIKLSSTPDRLRYFERLDSRKRLPSSMSMPSISSSSSTTSLQSTSGSISGMSKSASARRLRARDPQYRDLLEEEEEDEDDDTILRGKAQPQRRESLMDLLNSTPPWTAADDVPPVLASTTPNGLSTSRRASLRPSLRTIDDSDPLHPMSVAMRVQDSQDSQATIDSQATSVLSEATSGEDPHVNTSPGARMRALKAKDERRDLASERQVNTDLMDFFSSTPPVAPAPENPFLGAPTSPLSPKRSRGGLRGFMSKVTGSGGSDGSSKKDDDSLTRVETPVSPKSGFSLPGGSRRPSNARSQSISGASIATSSSSVAAMTASGFAVPAARAAYNPPPGLGSPIQPPIRERRSSSITSSTRSRPRQQSLTQPPLPASASLPPGLSDTPPPQGILIKPVRTSIASASTTSLAPPVSTTPATTATTGSDTPTPSIRNPPKRSSSLKRMPRERETSAQSAGSGPVSARSSATSSPVPPPSAHFVSRAPRERESSAQSALTIASTTTSGTFRSLGLLQAGTAGETSAPPIVVVPNGLVDGNSASKNPAERIGAGSPALGHGARRPASAEEEKMAVEEDKPEKAAGPPTHLGPSIWSEEKYAEDSAAQAEAPTTPPLVPVAVAFSSPSVAAEKPSASSPPLPPAPLRTNSTTPLQTPSTPPQTRSPNRFSTSSSPLLAVGGTGGQRSVSPPLAAPRVTRFSAPSADSPSQSTAASLRSLSRSPNHQLYDVPSSPPKRASSLLASPPLFLAPGTPSTPTGEKSLSTTLKELRAAMLSAETRDECVDLVEALLRDYAKRVEARAEQESGKDSPILTGGAVEGKKEEGDGETEEDEQARLVEFFLSAGDSPASSSSTLPASTVADAAPRAKANGGASGSLYANKLDPAASVLRPGHSSLLSPTPEMRIPGGFDSSTAQQSPLPASSS